MKKWKGKKSNNMAQVVGQFNKNVISALNLNISEGTDILMGATNTQHMQSSHPADYAKYGSDIPMILANPDYVGINQKDNSIEFVKEYLINGDYVKVAVMVSSGNKYYARSLYVLNPNRVKNFITKGTLVKP